MLWKLMLENTYYSVNLLNAILQQRKFLQWFIIFLMKMVFCGRTVLDYAQMELYLWQLASRSVWTHCMIQRQSLVSRYMCEDLLTLFKVIINFIKNSPLRVRLFAKLCDKMGSEYISHYTIVRLVGLLVPKYFKGCLR